MSRTAANDIDSVAPFQKVGAVLPRVVQTWPLETRIEEMLRDPEALRAAYDRLMEIPILLGLTDRQKELLTFIETHMAEHGSSPTYRAMAEAIGSNLSSIYWLVVELEERGAIRRKRGARQSIVVLPRAS